MLDFYKFVENNPNFRQFNVDELLFTAYDCPIEVSPLDYFVEKNYFCYIIKGGLRWKTLKDEYSFHIGDAVFLKKGAHRVYKVLNGEFCALLIFMPDQFIESVIKNDVRYNGASPQKTATDSVIPLEDQTLLDYFNTILNYFSQSSAPSKSLLNIKFKELIVNIVTGHRNPNLKAYFNEVSHSHKTSIKTIMDHIFAFNLKVEDYAKLSGRSLNTFKRDFANTYQTSPGKWLKNKRLAYAKYLLETTDLNINDNLTAPKYVLTTYLVPLAVLKVAQHFYGIRNGFLRKTCQTTFWNSCRYLLL